MKRRRVLPICLFVACWVLVATSGSPQSLRKTEYLEFGTVRLTLGMPQDVVLGKLAGAQYQLGTVSDRPDQRTVLLKKADGTFWALGLVRFRNGTLTGISRSLGPEPQPGFEVGDALYWAIKGLEGEGHASCTVSTGANDGPGVQNRSVFVRCGSEEKYLNVHALNCPECSPIPLNVTSINLILGAERTP